jgi:heme-degrading monooxygenase HmoA
VSVLMTLRVSGDPKAVEATDPNVLNTIVERAKAMGATQHHFYGTDTEVLVVDEWPDEETFQKFFESSPEVKELMDRAGAGQPDITFWHHLDVDDDIG